MRKMTHAKKKYIYIYKINLSCNYQQLMLRKLKISKWKSKINHKYYNIIFDKEFTVECDGILRQKNSSS